MLAVRSLKSIKPPSLHRVRTASPKASKFPEKRETAREREGKKERNIDMYRKRERGKRGRDRRRETQIGRERCIHIYRSGINGDIIG